VVTETSLPGKPYYGQRVKKYSFAYAYVICDHVGETERDGPRAKGGEARKMSRDRHGRTKNDRKYRAERRKMCARKATSEIRVPLFHFNVRRNEVWSTRRRVDSSGFRCSLGFFFRSVNLLFRVPIAPDEPTLILKLIAIADSCRTAT